MKHVYDSNFEELLAKGGTYDINTTDAVTDKQFWGANITDDAVFTTIKGIPIGTIADTLAEITSAEVDLKAILEKDATVTGFAGSIYRANGHIITNVQLSAGKFHGYLMKTQISA